MWNPAFALLYKMLLRFACILLRLPIILKDNQKKEDFIRGSLLIYHKGHI